jgi:hypothetical protein
MKLFLGRQMYQLYHWTRVYVADTPGMKSTTGRHPQIFHQLNDAVDPVTLSRGSSSGERAMNAVENVD